MGINPKLIIGVLLIAVLLLVGTFAFKPKETTAPATEEYDEYVEEDFDEYVDSEDYVEDSGDWDDEWDDWKEYDDTEEDTEENVDDAEEDAGGNGEQSL